MTTQQAGREVEAGEKARYIATFYPQQQIHWLGSDCYRADPEGETAWDCTEYVTKNYTAAEIREMQDDNVGSEQLDRVRDDPNAPEWVREWDGPFEVRIAEAEATPAPKQQAVDVDGLRSALKQAAADLKAYGHLAAAGRALAALTQPEAAQ